MNKNSKIFIAGGTGLVGSAIVRRLTSQGYTNLLTPSSKMLDLTNTIMVDTWFNTHRPEYVILAAAKVGGIMANATYPADFIMANMKIQMNIIESSYKYDVTKLLFLGSSCIYPKECPQPIKEEYLMTSKLEPSNDAYATAKIAGIKMCHAYRDQYGSNFIAAMPCNLYGIGDDFHPTNSHLIAGIMRRMHGNDGVVWGTGEPRREFLFSDDVASACIYLLQNYNERDIINIGTGEDISIKEVAEIIKHVVGFDGDITYDTSKPDGTFRKVMDVSKIKSLGWEPEMSLEKGLGHMYKWWQNT